MDYINYLENTVYKIVFGENYIENLQIFLQSINNIIYNQNINKYFKCFNNYYEYSHVIKLIDNNHGRMTLVNYIVLILYKYGEYDKHLADKLVLKILLYLYYIYMPINNNYHYNDEQKVNILYYCINTYMYMIENNTIFLCLEDLNNNNKKINKIISKKINDLQEYICLYVKK